MNNISTLPRIIFLAATWHPILPPRELTQLIPQYDIISAVASGGVSGAAAQLDVPPDQIENMYRQGKEPNEGNETEFRVLLSQAMMGELELRRDDLKMGDYLRFMKAISAYMDSEKKALITFEEQDLGVLAEEEVEKIPKFESGFSPIDYALGGLYQAIMTIIARPGHGKTSVLLSMMEALRASNQASSLWYFEQEIPMPMMRYRMSSCTRRVKFISGKDKLICGSVSIDQIEAMVRAEPDPERVLFIDSPDVMAGGSGDQKRFAIEEVYMGMIRIKPLVKLIVCTSWPRRNDRQISLESGAEAWAKAWYSDIIMGMTKLGRASQPGYTNVKLNVPKNRFGPADNELTFQYHYGNLTWELNESQRITAQEGDDW